MNNITFNCEDINNPFTDKYTDFLRSWLLDVASYYNKNIDTLSYIFCSDNYILNINKQYLNHNYYTDIITFNYNENNNISGDVFVSIDTVKENAKEYSNNLFEEELERVVVHGLLHLIGFNDKSDDEQTIMTEEEDKMLKLRDVSRETFLKLK
jgi:rRNA maturation RNase YbeY